jgi:hypothetical protein
MERHSSFLFRLILAAVASGFSLDAAIAAPPLDAYGNLPQVELMRTSPSGDRVAMIVFTVGVKV